MSHDHRCRTESQNREANSQAIKKVLAPATHSAGMATGLFHADRQHADRTGGRLFPVLMDKAKDFLTRYRRLEHEIKAGLSDLEP